MYTFRFNPLFNKWVLLGTALPTSVTLKPGNIILGGRDPEFFAATNPRNPFIIEPEKNARVTGRMYADQPAVGEYEFLLFQGKAKPAQWSAKEWDRYLSLLQQRLSQAHHNPHIHHAYVSFLGAALASVPGYQRVGDLVLTSHPVASERLLSAELAAKILAKDSSYVIRSDAHGALYVPSAPMDTHEAWYVPQGSFSGIERIASKDRMAFAKSLAALMPVLEDEFPKVSFTMEIHTSLVEEQGHTWWVRIFSATHEGTPLSVRPMPEKFRSILELRLGGR